MAVHISLLSLFFPVGFHVVLHHLQQPLSYNRKLLEASWVIKRSLRSLRFSMKAFCWRCKGNHWAGDCKLLAEQAVQQEVTVKQPEVVQPVLPPKGVTRNRQLEWKRSHKEWYNNYMRRRRLAAGSKSAGR